MECDQQTESTGPCVPETHSNPDKTEPSATNQGDLNPTTLSDSVDEGQDAEADMDEDAEEENEEHDDGDKERPGTGPGDINLFAYLDRDQFTSEIFKIEITNLPRRFGIGQLRKKLIGLGLKPSKIKSLQMGFFAFVNFKCEEDRQQAMEVLEGHPWKGNKLKVKKANPAADPLLKKRKIEAASTDQQPKSKSFKSLDPDYSLSDRLNDAVSPLWKKAYEDQLKTVEQGTREFLKRLARDMRNNIQDPMSGDYLKAQLKLHGGLCCPLCSALPSPVLNGYRNKCEFTIGQSPDGVDKTIGFRIGSYKEASVCVVEPDDCIIIPKIMKQCTRSLQKFLQTKSIQPGFDPETKLGNWKMMTVRTNINGDAMVIVQLHPQKLSQEEIQTERSNLQDYYLNGDGQEVGLKSLYFQVHGERNSQEDVFPYEHLMGVKHLEEDLSGLKFRISPVAFFQVNTLAAEVLYNTVGDWCNLSANTVLLDICCGTGTIGLTLAKRVKKVVGIEMIQEAIDDAKINAQINGITNTEYHCGKAESVLPSLIHRYSGEDVVAVLDPPRSGLHPDVIRVIRKSDFVKRLVYVSCKPTGALSNSVDLTRTESRRVKGDAFRLTKAIPVDLFPHTPHSELVMLFDRSYTNKQQSCSQEKEKEIVESTLKQEIVQSTLKQETVESTPKQEIVESTLKQETVESTLKQEIVESTLKQEIVESTLKQETVESTPKQESVESTIKNGATHQTESAD